MRYRAGYDWQDGYEEELRWLLDNCFIDYQEYKFLTKELNRMNAQDRNLWRKVRRNETTVASFTVYFD